MGFPSCVFVLYRSGFLVGGGGDTAAVVYELHSWTVQLLVVSVFPPAA